MPTPRRTGTFCALCRHMRRFAELLLAFLLFGFAIMVEVPSNQVRSILAGYLDKNGYRSLAAWVKDHQFDWFIAHLPTVLFVMAFICLTLFLLDLLSSYRKSRKEKKKRVNQLTPSIKQNGTDSQSYEFTNGLDLGKLTNAQLKNRAFRVCADLRAFEAGYFAHGSRILTQADSSQSEGGRQWHRQIVQEQYAEHKRQGAADYKIRLHPRAQAVRHELHRRLGEFPPYIGDNRGTALEYGSLAGSSPLVDAAGYLEDLARRLPE